MDLSPPGSLLLIACGAAVVSFTVVSYVLGRSWETYWRRITTITDGILLDPAVILRFIFSAVLNTDPTEITNMAAGPKRALVVRWLTLT